MRVFRRSKRVSRTMRSVRRDPAASRVLGDRARLVARIGLPRDGPLGRLSSKGSHEGTSTVRPTQLGLRVLLERGRLK